MVAPPAYFARTLRGLEELSWHDIRSSGGAQLSAIGHRTIRFSSEAAPADLLALHGIEDLFLELAVVDGLSHERASLPALTRALGKVAVEPALQAIRRFRILPSRPAFSITASFVGSRNFNRWELAVAIRAGLRGLDSLQYIETKDQSAPPHDLHFRLVLEDSQAILGMRAGAAPLHKRPYMQNSLPGSLSPVAAFLMVRMAIPRAGEVLLDPLCGSGTIPIEAGFAAPDLVAMGLELDHTAAEFARKNAAAAATGASIQQGDIFNSKLEPASVDMIVSDLPWGEQTSLHGGDYFKLIGSLKRLLRPGGRVVLMSGEVEALNTALERQGFAIKQSIEMSLHGKHPRIFLATV